MPRQRVQLPWKTNDRCPCRSGEIYGRCCKAPEHSPRAKKFDLERAANQTGKDRAGCYLAGYQNCGEKLTIEHPISRNILEQFSNLGIRGFSGTDGTVDVVVPPKSAGYKVLCDHHNSDLSLLDTHAGQVFRDIIDAVLPIRHAQKKQLLNWVYVDGPKLEAWSTKVIAAHQAAGKLSNGGRPVTYQVDWNKIRRAILKGEFEPNGGLYICDAIAPNEVVGVQYHGVHCNGWLVGVRVVMGSFSFMTIFDPVRASGDTIPRNATYRSSIHQLYAQGGSAFLFFAWRTRAKIKSWSRGEIRYSQHGSSSFAPFHQLSGFPAQDLRTSPKPLKDGKASEFAPAPVGKVLPPSPPFKNTD